MLEQQIVHLWFNTTDVFISRPGHMIDFGLDPLLPEASLES